MWYRSGTITVTNGSATVTGSGTSWISNAAVGEALSAPDGKLYEITNIASDTSLTIGSTYLGATAAAQAYVIIPSQSYIRDLAQQAAELVASYASIASNAGTGKFGDGTLATPAVRFASDEDTGFYRSAANEVTFVAGGVAQFRYNTTGLVFLGSGGGGIVNLTTTGNTTLGDAAADTVTINGTPTINAPTAIVANSATNALRITQTGTGNALLVEDSANPDATPFVIDSVGRVAIGHTSTGFGYPLNIFTDSAFVSAMQQYGANANPIVVSLIKTRGATPASSGIISNNDGIGRIDFTGSDGASYIAAARIDAAVDGTPGLNDMPGRLVFSTTADGASSPAERMRIDSAGRVGIGGIDGSGVLNVGKALTGLGVSPAAFLTTATVNSDASGTAKGFQTYLSTQAASFNLSTLSHFTAQFGTLGAGSSITGQRGFEAASSLTGATNNYGFYSNIASGTGRWNFYAAGSASNYFAGNVGIARTAPSVELEVGDGTVTRRISIDGGSSGVGAGASLILKNGGTTLGGFGNLSAQDGSSYSNLLALNSYYGLTFNTLSTERMRINSAGRFGFNATDLSVINYRYAGNVSGSTVSYMHYSEPVVQSGVTLAAANYLSIPTTAAASFTLSNLRHFAAAQGTFGAGSAVTNQAGFYAENNLTGATNNYGFYSFIPSGTGRWNFYAAGSADNYFAGSVGIGGTAAAFAKLQVVGTLPSSSAFSYGISSAGTIPSTTTTGYIGFDSAVSTQAAAFTLTNLTHFQAYTTLGVGSVVTNQYGFNAAAQINGATNNYGFISSIAAGTGRWNFYAAGTARNYFAGKTAVGDTADYSAMGNPSITGGGNSVGVMAANAGVAYFQSYNSSAAVDQKVWRWGNSTGSLVFETVNDAYSVAALRFAISPEGRVGFGTAGASPYSIRMSRAISGGAFSVGTIYDGQVQADATSRADYFAAVIGAAAGTYANIQGFQAQQGTLTGTVTAQRGFNADASLIGTTNNYGFRSDLPAGTGRWNFYAGGTADNYFAGAVGIGGSASQISLYLAKNITGSNFSYSVLSAGAIQSDVTNTGAGYVSSISTAPVAFTLPTLNHFWASPNPTGAGSTVTNQFGFHASTALTGATNNFGFYSNIASGTGRWNFYAAGSAANYFAGDTLVGKTVNDNTTAGVAITASSGLVSIVRDGNLPLLLNRLTSDGVILDFRRSGSTVGSLAVTTTSLGVNTDGVTRMSFKVNGQTRFVPLAAAPAGAENGDVYYNSTTNKLQVYAAGAWVDLH